MASKPQTRGVLFVHSSPRALAPHIEWAVGRALGRGLHLDWQAQSAQRGSVRAEYFWQGTFGAGAAMASALHGWSDVRYEITEDPTQFTDGSRWMHTPALGIFHAQTDTAGNVVIGENALRAAMDGAGMNPVELHRELRLALGQEWDDELEPFRYASDENPVVWIHSSVG